MDVIGCRKRAEALRDEAERFGTRVSVSNTAARLIATDLLTLLDNQRGAVEEHRAFVEALTHALNDHGVPATPSWREAIDYLAEHGGSR